MPKSLEDIFNDDSFGLLDTDQNKKIILSDEDRLINAFEEINVFVDTHKREPSKTSMAEYALHAKLQAYRKDEDAKLLLKVFDRHNLLGKITTKIESLEDVLADDVFDLLETEGDTSIFTFKHTPKPGSRAAAAYIAQRKAMSESEFKKYEVMFHQVHKELKEGKRKLLAFKDAERNLIEGNFYLVDGLLAYLEVSNAEEVLKKNKSGDRVRLEGRTLTIFENGTISNMLFRSLGKAIHKNGMLVTNPDEAAYRELLENTGKVNEDDLQGGWIYVLKSKSENPEIKNLDNLYKIGFTQQEVNQRIRNATQEATYLYADVNLVAQYSAYNVNAKAVENLLHRFFGAACLDIELFDKKHNSYAPREWFIAPLPIINEAIELLKNETITQYRYDRDTEKIVLRTS